MRLLDFSKAYIGQMSYSDALKINYDNYLKVFLHSLEELERDFLQVAMFIYVADRIIRRSKSNTWENRMQGRAFRLRIPVHRPDHWSQEKIYSSLIAALDFFTGDGWEIEFVKHPSQRSYPRLEPLFDSKPSNPFVGLFSGGLDSFAGAVIQALANPEQSGVMVAAASNGRMLSQQRELLYKTNEQLRGKARPLIPLHIFHSINKIAAQHLNNDLRNGENTQRSRGFLFLSIGLAVARNLGVSILWVYENGVGAINLPHTPSGLGVDYTRAMNPTALALMGRFATEYFGSSLQINNASLWMTKGQMCHELNKKEFDKLAVQTLSCDTGTARHMPKNKIQCGRCTSCILRRVSLAAGGLELVDKEYSNYQVDLYEVPADKEDKGNDLVPVRAMKAQAIRIRRALYNTDSSPVLALLREFPSLRDVILTISHEESLAVDEVANKLVELLRSYLQDWEYFEILLPKANKPAA